MVAGSGRGRVRLGAGIGLFTAFVLAGPGFALAQAQNPQLGAQMRSANRQAGFDDGCDTARSSRIAPVKHRDEAAYAASDSYRSGWRQGFNTCQPQNDNTPERLLGSPFGGR